MSFEEDLEELESAEDFLQYFELDYDQTVVHVNRLHILQRFHDYIAQSEENIPDEPTLKKEIYNKFLHRAYQDFVDSDAQTEKVFKVFKMTEPQTAFVALDDIKL
ncbi:MAG: nitrogenase-stabilizing/protective protein NifW [Gammaproteobacteria bacterium]